MILQSSTNSGWLPRTTVKVGFIFKTGKGKWVEERGKVDHYSNAQGSMSFHGMSGVITVFCAFYFDRKTSQG